MAPMLEAMLRTAIVFATVAFFAVTQASARVELVLVDDIHLTGKSVERRGDEYLLETDGGTQLAIPLELVREIRLSGGFAAAGVPQGDEIREEGSQDLSLPGKQETEQPAPSREGKEPYPTEDEDSAEAVETHPDAEQSEQEVLAPAIGVEFIGPWALGMLPSSFTPSRTEQLAAFGRDQAYFQSGPISPTWQYNDVLGYETDVTQFNPSYWHQTPIDPTWSYEDVLGYETDATQFNPARWYHPPIRPFWYPTDGWPPPGVESSRDQ